MDEEDLKLLHIISMGNEIMKKDGEIGRISKEGTMRFFLDRAYYHAEVLAKFVTYLIENNIEIKSMSFNYEECFMLIDWSDVESHMLTEHLEDIGRIFVEG